ncbi:MAG: hypothetical protein KF809_17255 [Chloroflexi bacterium]|nr:hypothetical protein [Chloroflexota bacterium]
MSFIEIKPGRVSKTEGEFFTGPAGVHQVGLVEITDPYKFTPKSGPNAGVEQDRIMWVFAIEDGGEHDGKLVEYPTSTATGPKSNMYGLLTALFGGIAPPIGTKLEKEQLIGRSCLATFTQNGEYLNVTNLSALPASMLQQRFAQQTGTPTQGTPVAAPEPAIVAAGAPAAPAGDNLPF